MLKTVSPSLYSTQMLKNVSLVYTPHKCWRMCPQFILDTNVEECVLCLYSTQILKTVSPVYTPHKCWRMCPQFILDTNVEECVPSWYSTQMLKNVSPVYTRHKCWRLCPQFIVDTNVEECVSSLYSTQMLKTVDSSYTPHKCWRMCPQFILDTNVEDCVPSLYSKQMLTNVSSVHTRHKCWRMFPHFILDTNVEDCVPVYDVLSLNNSRFGDFVDHIYPIGLEIKDTTDTDRSAAYRDIHLEIDSECRFRTKLYATRDDFNFPIVIFQFISSNIPAAPAYGVYISRLIRYSRVCCSYQDFLDKELLLTRKLLNQGFLLEKLKSSLRKCYDRHHDLVDRYGISVSQIITDMFHLS